MTDISKIAPRGTVQERPIGRGAGIIPANRNTALPELQLFGSMRNASRGDQGAEELLRIMQGTKRAAADVQGALMEGAQAKFEREAIADRDQAAKDTLAGTVDDQRMKDSVAYRKWRTKGLLDSELVKVEAGINDDVTAFINSDEDGVWTPEDIDGIIVKRFRDMVLDENGQPKGGLLDSAEARAQITAKLNELRPRLLTQAHETMVTEAREKDLNRAIGGFVDAVPKGGEYNLDAFVSSLPPQINRSDALEAAMTGILAHAETTENLEGLDKLLTATKSDGKTPLLGYKDMARLRGARVQVEEQRERRIDSERKERYEANTEAINEMFRDGGRPKRDVIWQMERDDKIPAGTARMFINAIESEEREDRAEFRAARAEARSAAAEARNAYEDKVEVGMAYRVADWKAGNGPRNIDEFLAAARQMASRGDLGAGKQMASNIGALDTAWRAGRATVSANPEFKRYGKMVGEWVKNDPGSGAVSAARRGTGGQQAIFAAQGEYTNLVMSKRMSPEAAYHQVIRNHKPAQQSRPTAASVDAELRALEARRGR